MGSGSKRNYEVFISYSSKDKRWADAGCAVLERDRIRCWVAPRDITPGTEWGAAIISGMDSSRMMVLIFSNHANESAQVRREVERAISKGLIVLPFRVEDVKPAGAMEFALSNTHWLDGFTPPLERRFGLLAKSVKALLANDPGEPAEPAAPRVNQRPNGVSAPPLAESGTVDRRPCPICGEKIRTTAVKCRFCGEVFDSTLKEAKQRGGKKGELKTIALLQKYLVLCAVLFVVGCVAFGLAVTFALRPPMEIADLLKLTLIATGIGVCALSVILANKLYGTRGAILVLLLFVPFVNWVTLFVVNHKATTVLREKGFTVGIMGARLSEF